jgi:hypothetical protein
MFATQMLTVSRWLSTIAGLPSAIVVSVLWPLTLLQIAGEAVVLL